MKLIACKNCGAPIAANAKFCLSCGQQNKHPIYKRVWFWLLLVFVVLPVGFVMIGLGVGTNADPTSKTTESTPSNSKVSPKPSVFDGDCGITASAEMGTSIIGSPELTVSINNVSGKDISAIRFYVIPYNVYGDELNNWKVENNLCTDTTISAGSSNTIQYQFIENSVKTGKLYVYSVYFADGTEWGDKSATRSTILKSGALIDVSGES